MKNEKIIYKGKRIQKRNIPDDLNLSEVFHKKLKLTEDFEKLDNELKQTYQTKALILYKGPFMAQKNSEIIPKEFIKNLEKITEVPMLKEPIVLPKIHLDAEKMFEIETEKEESEHNIKNDEDLDVNYMELD